MNTIQEIRRINEEELSRGIAGTPASWHAQYSVSAWVYAGNLEHSLTEGDILCVLSQFGEIDDIHLIREEDTGKSKGFAFVKYQDARSCVLAVDNLVGAEVCGRSLRIDHVERYKLPKHVLEKDDVAVNESGQAYNGVELATEFTLKEGQDLFAKKTREDEKKEEKRKRKEERRKIREEREARRTERKRKKGGKEERRKHRREDDMADEARSKRKKKERKSARSVSDDESE